MFDQRFCILRDFEVVITTDRIMAIPAASLAIFLVIAPLDATLVAVDP